MSQLGDDLRKIHEKMRDVTEREVLEALGVLVAARPPVTQTGSHATSLTLDADMSRPTP